MARGDYFRLQIDAIRPLLWGEDREPTHWLHQRTSPDECVAASVGRLNVMSRSKYKTTLTDAHDGQEG